ncbi:MAG TPA: histidinol-phosphate transaminase [Blastocatellia bacterium]|nr:histidinol-phosphate transaminase [Blastocatellia bacterium]
MKVKDWFDRRLEELALAEGYPLPWAGAGSDGIHPRGKLDANENSYLPETLMASLMDEVAREVDPRFYPAADYAALVSALAATTGFPEDHILLGSGADQLIAFLCDVFLGPTTTAVSVTPTYSFYRIRSRLTGARFIEVPLRPDFSLDVERMRKELAAPAARLLFLCSPNNPTGNSLARRDVEQLIADRSALVVVDEAYVEYAEESLADLVREYDNVVILRTMSKAWGLAGMRLGYMIGRPRLIRVFAEKVQYPYPLNAFALRLAVKLLAQPAIVRGAVDALKAERERLRHRLLQLGLTVFPSQTNFLLLAAGDGAEGILSALADRGIRIKLVGDVLGWSGCLRITVGVPEVNDLVVETLRECLR